MKEPTNRELLNRSLDLLQDGIRVPIESEMRRRWNIPEGTAWIPATWKKVNPRGGTALSPTTADTQFLLKCMKVEWRDTFAKIDRTRFSGLVEGHVRILIEARNTVSHNGNGSRDMSADEAREMAQSALRILEAFQAEEQVTAVRGIIDELRRRDAASVLGVAAPVAQEETPVPHGSRAAISAHQRASTNPECDPEQETGGATAGATTGPAQEPDARMATSPRRSSAVPTPILYSWNVPSNVSKDARYTCGLDGTIRLVFDLGNREETLLTTDQHPELVAMVQACKHHFGESPAGVFYINEYGHVLVKAADKTWYSGHYHELLEFEFEGRTIGPKPAPGLKAGDRWNGPHVGINYKLAADGRDIYFRRPTRPGVLRKEVLSDYVDPAPVLRLARPVKLQGGRLYLNEARALFTPIPDGGNVAYTYLGSVEPHEWFPAPNLSE